jgi:hypothetical protein
MKTRGVASLSVSVNHGRSLNPKIGRAQPLQTRGCDLDFTEASRSSGVRETRTIHRDRGDGTAHSRLSGWSREINPFP